MYKFEFIEFMDESEQICGNCEYWDTAFMVAVAVRDDGPFGRVSHRLAPCRENAVEMDAGEGGIPLLAGCSHCRNHAAAFSPSPEFLRELEERAEAHQDDAYGVRPGVDYPLTLCRNYAA